MSSLVFPFHDPNNIETKYLKQILPILKANFDNAFVSVTPKTALMNTEAINFLKSDDFFVVNENSESSSIGDHFLGSYKNAVENSKPEQVLHLCTIDRVAFALINYQNNFLNDLNNAKSPTLFVRSEKAWSTHPKNYHAAESMVTEVGKILYGKILDFCWCHLTISADQLKNLLPSITAKDLVVLAQIVLSLRNQLDMKDVDWLSWEDPFIYDKDPQKFKLEKENDPTELEKRMSYVLPEIKYLFEEFRKL